MPDEGVALDLTQRIVNVQWGGLAVRFFDKGGGAAPTPTPHLGKAK